MYFTVGKTDYTVLPSISFAVSYVTHFRSYVKIQKHTLNKVRCTYETNITVLYCNTTVDIDYGR